MFKRTIAKTMGMFICVIATLFSLSALADTEAVLNLPAGLKTVDEQAFYGASALNKVIVPDGTQRIESKAFANSGLKEVTLPRSLNYIAEDAFDGCGQFKVNVPIGCYAFSWCIEHGYIDHPEPTPAELFTYEIIDGLYVNISGYTGTVADIVIPETIKGYEVKQISNYAFMDNHVITNVYLPDTITKIGYGVFRGCKLLYSVDVGNSITEIGGGAFKNCKALYNIDLSDSISYISYDAFSGCDNLTIVNYPKELKTAYSVFQECPSLRNITVPEGVTQLPNSIFKNSSITDISLPNTLTEIGANAFENCDNLIDILLPDSIRLIGANAFGGCDKLSTVNYPKALETAYEIFNNCPLLKKITVPEGVKYLPSSVFEGSSLSEVYLPNTLTEIDAGAFRNCDNLEEIHLPDSIETIHGSIFYDCDILSVVNYPKSLKDAGLGGVSLFENCPSLIKMTVPDGVTQLPSWVFANSSLSEITLPDSLTTIRVASFENCTNLTTLYLGCNVTSIYDETAFRGCDNLTIWTEYGAYALQYAKNNNIPYYYLTPDGVNSPSGTLYKGDSYALYGYARSSVNLTDVTATIKDGTGNVVQTISVNPATTDYSLAGTINTSLLFGTLPLGSYRYTLTARTDVSEEVWADNAFTIVPPPLRIYISGLSLPSGYVPIENTCALGGTVISNYIITQITIELSNMSTGTTIQKKQIYPDAYTYDLSFVGIGLASLGEGEYSISIIARSNGETRILAEEGFVLGDVTIPEGIQVDAAKILAFVNNTDNKYIFNKYNADYTYKLAENMSAQQQFLLGLRTNEAKLIGQVRSLISYAVTGDLRDYYLINLYKKEITNYLLSQGEIIDDTWSLTDKIKAECGFDAETMLKIAESFVSFNSIRTDYLANEASDMVVTKDMKAVYDIINQNLKRYNWELDRVEDINTMGQKLAEICRDYAGGIAVLNDLENAMPLYMEDKAFQDAIRELKGEYQSKVSKNINKLFDYAAKEAVKEGSKLIAKYVLKGISAEVYVTYKISKLAWDTIADLTGLYSEADSFIDYQSRCAMFYATENAFIEAFETCGNGDMSDRAIGRLIRTFEYTRNAGIRVIDKARSMNIQGIIDSDLVQKKRGLERLSIG